MTRRVAVVGLGVGWQHVASWQRLADDFEVAAICDLDEERCRVVAERHEIPRVFHDFDALLESDDLDVIDLCTPPHLHAPQIEAVLETGRYAICEKPIAPSVADVDALIRAEEASPGRVMPIFQYRFGRGLQQLLHLRERGLTGRAYLSTVETAWYRGPAYYQAEWRGRWKTEMGGALLSHAIHAHDLLTHVVGPVSRVFARARTLVNPIETEDTAAASLEMADGSLATLSVTLGSRAEISRLRFCFEKLTAESSLSPYQPSFEPWTFTAGDPEAQAEVDAALADFEGTRQLYTGQFQAFARALDGGGPLPVSLADARAALELVTALYHSAETGSEVGLPIDEGHPKYASWLPAGI